MEEKPCCVNCVNKSYKGRGDNNLVLYCEAKEEYVLNDGICQWYDRAKNTWKRRDR